MDDLVQVTDRGLFVPAANVYIDPWQPVERAVITHAHSDHARAGHRLYLAHPVTGALLQTRLGSSISLQTLPYGKKLRLGSVQVSFHPAGHVPGSAQVRLEFRGRVCVVSGDYKRHSDGLSAPFEPVRCHMFLTESTFGLPVFRWEPAETLGQRLCLWVTEQLAQGRHVCLTGYSLGKAQRLIRILNEAWIVPFVHPAIEIINQTLKRCGIRPGNYSALSEYKKSLGPAVILLPPAAVDRLPAGISGPFVRAACSGWMAVRGMKRRQNLDKGFALSDHADWPGLLKTMEESEAERVWVTHGFAEPLARYMQERGRQAEALRTAWTETPEEAA
ncbi:MAG: ligase-associated DNA damage response exonuclease [Flavobacteriales bacterium]|nr:ligase-associated DNA damage response exonuclease [Flavobacteriales bacterium]MDW8410674.1 ligase-associated DNA damage response exonuclease [Flavobacteriales bacterium]